MTKCINLFNCIIIIKVTGIFLILKTIFREQDVIYNSTLDHKTSKIKVANVIAYQTISHWYDGVFLWSKKGFITFLTAHILHQVFLYLYYYNIF